MPIDPSTYPGDWNETIPTVSDFKVEGPANFQQIKRGVKALGPNWKGPITASHTELSYVKGVTAPIQEQLAGIREDYAPKESPSFTGVPRAPTAPPGTNSTQVATTAHVAASYAPLNSPALTGSPTAPTPPVGSSGTRIATMDALNAASFSTNLPGQTGNSGKYLKTVDGVAFWDYAGREFPEARTSNTALTSADANKLISLSGTFTQTFSLTPQDIGWKTRIRNSGAGDITVTSDGVTFAFYPGAVRDFTWDGSALKSVPIVGGSKTFSANGSFTPAPGVTSWHADYLGAAGGGGGGASTGIRYNGGGGGSGGRVQRVLRVVDLTIGTPVAVTVGVGGAGGTGALNSGAPNGLAGLAGGASSITGIPGTAPGGAGGGPGTGSGHGAGGNGGDSLAPGWTGVMGRDGSVSTAATMAVYGGQFGGLSGAAVAGGASGAAVTQPGQGGGGGGGGDGTLAGGNGSKGGDGYVTIKEIV